MSCLLLVSYAFADQPSSDNFILIQRGFLVGNANQTSPPGSTSYDLTENSMLGIAGDAETSAGYLNYPGFLQPNNHAPTIVLPDDFTFEEDDGLVVDFTPFINDINGDIVTISVSGNTDVIVDIVDFTVTFSATADWNGTETITFTANDNMDRAVASDDVDIIVTPVNDAPTIILPDTFTFDEDDGLIVDFTEFVDDVDLDVLTLSVTGNIEITIDIVDLQVTFGATENWNGSEILTFTVDDGQGDRVSFSTGRRTTEENDTINENSRATADDDVEVIVLPVNDDPTITLPDDFTFEEDQELIVDFAEYVEDVDLDDLTLSVEGNTEVTVDIVGLEVTFGATENWNGTETLIFTVDDGQGERVSFSNSRATAEDDVDVIVLPVNDDPTIILPADFTFEEDGELIVDFTAYVDDVDPDDLTLSVIGNIEVIVDINGLEVTFGATENWNGTETLTFIIDDNVTRATAEDDVDVIVTPVNDEPVLINWFPIDLVFTVTEDTTVAFCIEVEDIDSELSYSWYVNLELQTETTDSLNYEFTEPGDFNIDALASDGEYEVGQTWLVHVLEGVISDPVLIPQITNLQQNFPNPFNPVTNINYSLVEAGKVKIEIFNIKGEKIRTLVDENKNVGYHSAIWNGKDNSGKTVASGMYFYNMVTNEYHRIRKMILLK